MRLLSKHWGLRLFLFWKLPLAYWAGVRLLSLSNQTAIVRMRYRWINTNPFGSMYFAAMEMGAELSTGILLYQHRTAFRFGMLLKENEATYLKKADGKVWFECTEGDQVLKELRNMKAGEKFLIRLRTEARNEQGDVLARFSYLWSIKSKDPEGSES